MCCPRVAAADHGFASRVPLDACVRRACPSCDGLGAQVCGAAQLPVPSARYSMGADRTVVSVGEGAFHLHVAQVNAVLHL